MTGLTSSISSKSRGGGATDARAIPLPETTLCGTPRSEARVWTVTGARTGGGLKLALDRLLDMDADAGAEAPEAGPGDEEADRSRAFSISSSFTRTSR